MPINYNFESLIPSTTYEVKEEFISKKDYDRTAQTASRYGMVDPKYKADFDEGVNLTNAYARAISKSYNFYTADPVAHLSGQKKQVELPFQPTIKELPDSVKMKAEMVKLSTVWEQAEIKGLDGLTRANERLKTLKLDAKILPEYSNSEFVALEFPNGEVKVAFRGTNPSSKVKSGKYAGRIEPNYWKEIAFTGTEGRLGQFKEAEKMLNKLTRDPRYNVSELMGYSMGGTKALKFGDAFNIKTTTFNPFLGLNALFGIRENPSLVHEIYKTTGDVASSGLSITEPANFKVNSIEPIRLFSLEEGKAPTPLPEKLSVKAGIEQIKEIPKLVQHHFLEHFTETGDRLELEKELKRIESKGHLTENLKKFKALEGQSLAYRRTLLNGLMKGSGIFGNALALGANILGGDIVGHLDPKLNELHPEIQAIIVGGGGSAVAEGIIGTAKLGTQALGKGMSLAGQVAIGEKTLQGALTGALARSTPSLTALAITIRTASVAGALGGLGQTLVAENMNNALVNAGLQQDDAFIISQAMGGGVGGALTVASIPFIEAGASVLGTGIASLTSGFITSQVLATTASTALAEGLLGAELAVGGAEAGAVLGAEAGSFIPGFGTAIGALAGAVIATAIAGISVSMANRTHYVLMPFRNERLDNIISKDLIIQAILRDFNDSGDYSPQTVERFNREIQQAVDDLSIINRLDNKEYGYIVNLTEVPLSTPTNNNSMLKIDYSQIPEELQNAPAYMIEGTPQNIEYVEQIRREQALERTRLETIRNENQEEINKLMADIEPLVSTAKNYVEINEIIRMTLQSNPEKYTKLLTNPNFKIPQYGASGNSMLVSANYLNENIALRGTMEQLGAVQPDFPNSMSPEEKIIYETIENDPNAKFYLKSGDTFSYNRRIRDIFAEKSNLYPFNLALQGQQIIPQQTFNNRTETISINDNGDLLLVAPEERQKLEISLQQQQQTADPMMDTITKDIRARELILSGNVEELNKRIREIIYEKRLTGTTFDDIINFNSKTMPQFLPDGSIIYQGINELAPTHPQYQVAQQTQINSNQEQKSYTHLPVKEQLEIKLGGQAVQD